MNEQDKTRAEKLGELIIAAREHAGFSPAECAHMLGVTPDDYQQIEQGERPVSLPELEAMALFFQVPMGYFWGTASLKQTEEVKYHSLIALRHRVVAVLLRQLRLKARRSREALAEATDLEPERIAAYESGETPVPYLDLEKLSRALGVSIDTFVEDQHGPLGRHEAEHRLRKLYERMPPEMKAFLLNPTSEPYLETAKTLSEMDVERLRLIAESILDITF